MLGDKMRPALIAIEKHTNRIKGVESRLKELEPEVHKIRELEMKHDKVAKILVKSSYQWVTAWRR